MNRKGRLLCAALLAAQLALHAGALAPPVERAAAVCESGQLSAALLALELGDLRRGEWRELSAEEIERLKAL